MQRQSQRSPPLTLVCCSKVVSWRAVATLLIIVGATSLAGCATKVRELMPTPALYHSPAAKAVFEGVPTERRTDYVDLLYVTDRAPDNSPEAELPYGEERSRSLAFGSAQVVLQPPMDWEELQRHSLSDPRDQQIAMEVGAIKELGRYPTEPYPIQAVAGGIAREPKTLAEHERIDAALQSEVQRRLRTAPTKEVVLYVHGFNETFASAAYTAAELCHFFGRAHVCSFFTWPASTTGGPLTSYISTTESALYSVSHLKKTIRTLALAPGVKGLHLLAHSRGTAVLLNAVRELSIEAIAAGKNPDQFFKFENWVLMSPDIDVDVASQQLELFASDPGLTTQWRSSRLPQFLRGRLTVYASPEDKALRLSEILFRSKHRVGQLSPDAIPEHVQDYYASIGGVDIIVYEGKKTDRFGHSYFASNPRVSADLVELIRNGTPPGAPGRPLIRSGKITWVFPAD
jgi:esterase/lipase superfamily enzyme